MQPPSPDDQPTIRTGPPNGSRPAPLGWQAPSVEEMQALLPQYEIMEILGRGGMGAVYKGRQKSLKRLVAIKILPLGMADDEMKFVERFQNEAQTMAAMNHPAIVSVYDFGETPDGLLYFIMEFVDGTDVQKMIQASGKLSGDYALAITAHVCDALAYAHKRGVIHRDIKPANILIDQEGHIKVADFGLAKMSDPAMTSGLTKTNMAMGTPDYVAPEVLTTGMVADHRADIYAVGVMLYQMLTGEVPRGMFKLPSQKGIGSDPRFDAIICKAMEQDREERYQSAMDVRHALDVILTTPQPKDDGTGVVPVKEIPQKPVAKGPRPPGEKNQPPAQKPAQKGAPQQAPAQKAAAAPKAKAPPKKQSPAAMWLSIGGIVAVLGVAGFLVLGGKSKPVADLTDPSTASQPAQPQAPIKVRENPPSRPVSSPSSARGKTIELLTLVDLKRDEFEGDWTRTADGLAKQGPATVVGGNNPRVRLPYEPPEEYDIEFEFTPGKGTQSVGLFLIAESRYFSWILGGGKGDAAGFELFDTKPTSVPNELSTTLGQPIEAGRRYRSRVEVRAGTLRGYLDDKKLIDWDGRAKFTRLGTSVAALKKEAHLGLRAARDVVFHNLTVREVSGAGRLDAGTATTSSSSAAAKTIDILPLVDVKRDMIGGEWSRDGGDLVVKATKPDANGTPRLQLPYQPPEEYDFEIEFTPESGTNMAGQALSAYQHSFSWFMDGKTNAGSKAGFDAIDGIGVASRTDGTTMRQKFLTNGQRHRSTVEVRKTGVRGLLDGELLVSWGSKPSSYERLEISKNEKMRDALHLGLIAYDRAVRFHKITVREITGAGKVDANAASVAVPAKPLDPATTIDWLKADIWRAPWVSEQGVLKATSKDVVMQLGKIDDGIIRVRLRDVGVPAASAGPSLQIMVRYAPITGAVTKDADYLFQFFPQKRTSTLIYLERSRADLTEKTETLWNSKVISEVHSGARELEFEIHAEGDELSLWTDGKAVASVHDARLKSGKVRIISKPGIEITRLETVGVTEDHYAVPAAQQPPPTIANWRDVTEEAKAKAKSLPGLIVDAEGIRLDATGSRVRLPLTPPGQRDQAVLVRYTGEAQVDLHLNSSGFLYVLAQIQQTVFQSQPAGNQSPLKLVPNVLHPADFDIARQHELLVTIEGTRLRAWLDGRFIAEAKADTFTEGATALFVLQKTVVHKVELADLTADPNTAAASPSGTEKIDWLKSAKWDAPWSIANGRLKSTDKDKTRYLGVAREAMVRLRFRDDGSEAVSKTSPPLQVTFYGHAKGGSQANEGTYQLQVFPARHRLLLAKINKDAVTKADVPTSIWKDVAFPAAPPGEEDMELQLRSVGDEISVWSGAERLASAHDDRGRAGGWLLIGSPGVEITALETSGITPNPGTISPPEAGNAPPQIANWQDVTATLLEKARGIQGAIIQDGAVHLAKGSAPQHVLLTPTGMSHFSMRVRYTGGTQIDRVKEGYGFHFVICQESQVGFKRVTKGAVSEDLCPWASHPAGYDSNAPHDLLVTMNGAQIRAWVDGFFMGEARDEVITEGEGWLMLKDYTIIHKVEVAEMKANPGGSSAGWQPIFMKPEDFGGDLRDVEFRDGAMFIKGRSLLPPAEPPLAAIRSTLRYLEGDRTGSLTIRSTEAAQYGEEDFGLTAFIAPTTGANLVVKLRDRSAGVGDGKMARHDFPISPALKEGELFTFELRAEGKKITAIINGREVGSVDDSWTGAPRRFGITPSNTDMTEFRDVAVMKSGG